MDHINIQDLQNQRDIVSGEIIGSTIQAGTKREFSMTMEAYSDMGELPLCKRRVTESQVVLGSSKDNARRGFEKKVKGFSTMTIAKDSERQRKDERKMDDTETLCNKENLERCAVEVEISEGDKNVMQTRPALKPQKMNLGSSPLSLSNLETKTSNPKVPTKLKNLLCTGWLDGLRVFYKLRGQQELQGVIKSPGILCSCNLCEGKQVVTPIQFELHAHSKNKRPSEYIYLENGNTLRDVLNACKIVHSSLVEEAVKNASGCSDSRPTPVCYNCKGLIREVGVAKSMLLCDSCKVLKEAEINDCHMSYTTARYETNVSSISVASSSQPEIRAPGSAQTSSSIKPQEKAQGQLTKKDSRMHKLVFEKNKLPDGSYLSYVIDKKKKLEGHKEGSGIFCLCCNKVVSPSMFEAHAGFASRRNPYMNIFTSNGVSLHELSIQLSKKLSSNKKDDLCFTCAEGETTLFCTTCPRAFHLECASLACIPEGLWHCRFCQNKFKKEKFAERNANAIAAGRVAGVDALEEINQQRIRIAGKMVDEVGECSLCRGHHFSDSGFDDDTVMICDQCEKEYHVGCLRQHNIDNLKELPEGKWFCCTQCNSIDSTLLKLIEDGEKILSQNCLNPVKKRSEKEGSYNLELDIKWRLLNKAAASEDNKWLLHEAKTIFRERFGRIADSSKVDPNLITYSGDNKPDLITKMVYGSTSGDYNFGGIYCAMLMVNSFVVSVGLVRIFGEEVAELPLVATRSNFQGKGYFKSLYNCIESLLKSLKVKNLVLPAAHEAKSMWKQKFGFEKLSHKQMEPYMKYPILSFEGTSILHKSISNP